MESNNIARNLSILAIIISLVISFFIGYEKALGDVEIEIWLSYSDQHVTIQRLDMVDENFKPSIIYTDKIECGGNLSTGSKIILKPQEILKDKDFER